MQNVWKDIRLTARVVRRSAGFSATAVAVMALGIGAATAIFSVINAVLLAPLPFPDSERIVVPMTDTPQGPFPVASVPKYNLWRRQTRL